MKNSKEAEFPAVEDNGKQSFFSGSAMKSVRCAHALLMTALINSCKHVILVLSHQIQVDLRQKFNYIFLLIYFHERHHSRREKQDTNVNEDVSQTPSNYSPVFNGIVY